MAQEKKVNTKEALQWLLEGKKIHNVEDGKHEYLVYDAEKDRITDEANSTYSSFRSGLYEIWKDPTSEYVKRSELEQIIKNILESKA